MKFEKKNVLIIAPHCDDEILGCGGYISKYKNKKNFFILYLTNANKGDSIKYTEGLIKKIRNEAKKTSNFLGVKKIFFEDFPAPKLDTISSSTISDKISNYLKLIRPSEVFLPFGNDTHIDHQKVYISSITALRPFLNINKNLEKIYCYETLSETDFAIPNKKLFNPNFFVRLSQKNLEDKIKAIKMYKTQIKTKPHPRSTHAIKVLASYRGILSNFEYSEAFIIIRAYDIK